jgi:hypothetical protein
MIYLCIVSAYLLVGMFTGVATYVIGDMGEDPRWSVTAGIVWPLVPPTLAMIWLCSWAERMRVRRKKMLAERAALRAAIEYEVTKLP